MKGPSVWWPLPVAPERWFTEEERARADGYHRPIERAELVQAVAQLVLLLAVLAAGRDQDWGRVVRVLLIGGAIWVPRFVVDTWREFIHEPRLDSSPVSILAFAMTFVGRATMEGLALVVVDWWLVSTDGVATALVPMAVAVAVPVVATLVGPRAVLVIHRAADIDPDAIAFRRVAELAAATGASMPRVVELDAAAFDGLNAFATGTGRRVTVALSRRLVAAPADLFAHVVSHELAHLRRRHLWRSAAASGAALGVITALAIPAASLVVDSAGVRLAVFVTVAGLVSLPLRIGLAWLSRGHERQADGDALAWAVVQPASVKWLHLVEGDAIESSWFARWFSEHPAPAERLERIARAARAS